MIGEEFVVSSSAYRFDLVSNRRKDAVKHLSKIFCTCIIALLFFLIVPILTVNGQQVKVSDETQPAQPGAQIFSPASFSDGSISSPKVERKYLLFRTPGDEGNCSLVNHPAPTPQQPTSAAGAYVFPSGRQRLNRYVWDTLGPLTLIGVGVAAGIDQGQNSPPEWNQGASGYGKRFGSRLGQHAIEQTTSYALSEALRLDTGFEKSQRHGFSARLGDALIQNVTSRTRTGKRIISAPRLAGAYVSGLVPALTWYPSRFSYKDGLREGTYSLAAGFAVNVFREFIFHR
jgi:hypothetical protein